MTNSSTRSIPVMKWLSALIFGLAILAVITAFLLYLSQYGITNLIVAPEFVLTYIILLALLVLWRLLRDAMALRNERQAVHSFVQSIRSAGGTRNRVGILRALTDETDANSVEALRSRSNLLSKLAMLIRQVRATEPSKLYEQSILPSTYALRAFGIAGTFKSGATADLVIRIALLGTFVGIVAALTIASSGLTSASPSGPGRLGEMQSVLQQLLAAAAAKFWISAAGLAGAIVLIVFERYCLRSVDALVDHLGGVVDELLIDPEAARSLCRPEEHLKDPIRDQLLQIAEQIRASADKWILTVKIGGARAGDVPSISLAPPS